MSSPLLECVPNFSEGRRTEALEEIVNSASSKEASVLDVHSDPDLGRCVVTLAGPAEPLVEAVTAAATAAVDSIDLADHEGAHPRLGAVDVVPFVPLGGASMQDAAHAAHDFASAFHRSTRVPVFFYGHAADPHRDLPRVRRSAFAGLDPDIGGPDPHPTAGACVVGARPLMVAYNVNLTTKRLDLTTEIAAGLRESTGGLPGVRALAFALESRGCTQVSMNLTRPLETTVADAYTAVVAAAREKGVEVASSEIVGLVPVASLAGRSAGALRLEEEPKTLERALKDAGFAY